MILFYLGLISARYHNILSNRQYRHTSSSQRTISNKPAMMCWTLFLLLSIQLFPLISTEYRNPESLCASQQSCSSCLLIPRCVWCAARVIIIFTILNRIIHAKLNTENNRSVVSIARGINSLAAEQGARDAEDNGCVQRRDSPGEHCYRELKESIPGVQPDEEQLFDSMYHQREIRERTRLLVSTVGRDQ